MSACNHRKASSLISTQNLLMSGTPVSIIKHVVQINREKTSLVPRPPFSFLLLAVQKTGEAWECSSCIG